MGWMDDLADQIGSYSSEYVPSEVIETMASSHLLGIFLRLDTNPALHIWMGVNDIPAGFDSIDEEGTVYLGGGRLLNVPTLEVLVNGQSDSVEFGIAGIDPATAQKVLDEMPPVRGRDIRIGLTTLDDHYQPTASPVAIWGGTASHVTETSEVVKETENATTAISLASVSGNNTRSRASASLWSSAHQKALYPTDLFCDGTSRLARGVAPVWPNY